MLVVGAVEIEDGGRGPGRIRLSQVADYSAASLHGFIAVNVAPGATAKTDGWSGYPGAAAITHDHHVVGKMAAHLVLPWGHRIFSNLKRCYGRAARERHHRRCNTSDGVPHATAE